MKASNLLHFVASTVLVFAPMTLFSQTKTGSPAPQHGVTYQPLNMKTGLWEMTVNLKTSGDMVPPGMMEKLTPEQRARLEARMNANSGGNAKTDTQKHCVTKEGLEKPINFGDKDCSWTILESTSTRAKGNVSCQGTGITMSGNGEFEAPDPEHVRGFAHMTSNQGGNKMTVDSNFTWKWLGSSCGNTQ